MKALDNHDRVQLFSSAVEWEFIEGLEYSLKTFRHILNANITNEYTRVTLFQKVCAYENKECMDLFLKNFIIPLNSIQSSKILFPKISNILDEHLKNREIRVYTF
jgi:hypothetical protein